MAGGLTNQVDRDRLHKYFYRRRDKRDRLKIKSGEFAILLGVTPSHMGRILREFVEDGRIKVARVAPGNVKTYIIHDPETYAEPAAEPEPKRRVPVWG